MGYNCYVNNALLPTVRMMQEAYKNGMVSLTDLHLGILDIIGGDNGNHGDHQNGDHHKEESRNEEKLPPCTPFSKEEKKKEERGSEGKSSAYTREVEGKDVDSPVFLNPPKFEDVKAFFEAGDFMMLTAEDFYKSNNEAGWRFKRGNPICNWQRAALDLERWRRTHNWKPAPETSTPQSQPETFAEKKQKILLAAESRMQEKAERQTAEREERLKRQAEESVSWAEYQRMKQEGKV